MLRSCRIWILLPSLAWGCSVTKPIVYVDLDHVRVELKNRYSAPSIAHPPKPLGAAGLTISAIPAKRLDNSSSPEVLKPQEDADRAQEDAIRKLRIRLLKVYNKQADLFAEQQKEMLGNVEEKRLAEVMPELRAAFVKYADERLPLIVRLSFLAGVPDTNPKNLPPPAEIRPVPKKFWVEANGLRSRLSVLDKDYSAKATAILGRAGSLANNDRLELLKKVEGFRQQMIDRAMSEASDPLRSKIQPIVLRLQSTPEINLPAEPARTMLLPSTAPLPSAPQVESKGMSENLNSRVLLEKQLKIWAATQGLKVVVKPQPHVREATEEFEKWRRQQGLGP